MKLFIKNKIMSVGAGSTVKNEAGEDVYRVKGKWFSPTKKKIIKDMDGNVLYKVRNKWFNFLFNKAYILDSDGQKVGKVTNDGMLGFKIVDYTDNVVVQHSAVWVREIYKNGELIGTTTRNFDLWRDSFTLDIKDDEDIPFYIALVIALDNIRDKDRNSSR